MNWLYVVVPVLAAIGLLLLLVAINDWLRRFWALEHAYTVHLFEHACARREHVHHMGGGKFTGVGRAVGAKGVL